MSSEQAFVVYDRMLSDDDDANVLVSCSSLREARSYARTWPGCPIYSYDIVTSDGGTRTGVNETFVEVLK